MCLTAFERRSRDPAESVACRSGTRTPDRLDRVQEFSRWLARSEAAEPPRAQETAPRLRIGLQDSCHLRNALGVWREPRELLARVGEYVELPSAGACCGAAGSYAILRPRDSARILDKHLDEIADAGLNVLAVVNPGCYRQLQQGVRRRKLRTRVMHLVEVLATRSER